MDIQWSMIWSHSNKGAASGRQQNPLADPLERSEWKGLDWAIALLSKLTTARKNTSLRKQKMTQVERFTSVGVANGVCVS